MKNYSLFLSYKEKSEFFRLLLNCHFKLSVIIFVKMRGNTYFCIKYFAFIFKHIP